ncbi:hypothetical protein [Actinomadura sp. DC4]|uniref:hypothetical protein n=1 Tax=Actinomadura sp. DC4 TaxID=3055069 RepID=UPI0025B10EDD|nr:hypothetical protein [Actinomadura sp. DC4]MDN3359116.1 hypothetical protein [Actinomadura sp. DC4]
MVFDGEIGGVSPTRAGSLLAEHARRILDLQERMLAELTAAATTPAGPVRLCAPESMCAYLLAPLLSELRRRLPDVRCRCSPPTRARRWPHSPTAAPTWPWSSNPR